MTIKRDPLGLPVLPLDEICFPADHRVAVPGSLWWVAWDGTEPVAFAGLRLCSLAENRGLGFLCRAGVVPAYRGRGLQKKLIRVREAAARQLGLKELVTYCLCSNSPSMNSLVSCGYRFYVPATKYGGSGSVYLRKEL
jgi:GNAT superfamily N-acetyltransferase